jgi:steroid delta-isomerase-like uncharacterized protein
MSTENNKAVIWRWIEEAWNKGNAHIADEIYTADFKARDIDDPTKILHGPEDIKQSVIKMRTAFPDIHFVIDHLFAEKDMVVGVFIISGTHQGYLGDIPPTGKRVVFTAVDMWRFEEGKIAERRLALHDRLDLLKQLGIIPPMR